ncbi:MAG: molybdenum cofactor guanylyltransferase MobA [Halioglobus sp.]
MSNKVSSCGLILAGGAGRRVGGEDKGLLSWQGKPLIEHVATRLSPQVDRLVISCNRNLDKYAQIGTALVQDSRADFQGPLAGIEAATPHTIDSTYTIVVACDTPLLPPDLVCRLLKPLSGETRNAFDISYANDGERDQYLCAAIRNSCLDSLKDYLANGQRAVRHWYALQRAIAVDFSDQPGAFLNYNHLDATTGQH